MNTHETTIDELAEGDVVTAIAGKPRPFPYTVTQVVTTKLPKYSVTLVKFAHGGLITPCDSKTKVTVSNG